MKRCLLILTVLALLLCGLLPAAAQSENTAVTMVLTRDPVTFDPQGPIDPSAPILLAYVYDTLLFQDKNGEIQPYLAEQWEVSEGGSAITFFLRDDVVFSNGAPLNADAVIFTFKRLQDIGQRSFIFSELGNVTEFEKVDDYTVTFHLRQPSATLLSALTYTYAAILEPGAVTEAGEDYGRSPVGSGPFMVVEWTPENSMTLVKNPEYQGQRPVDETGAETNITELRIRFTDDQAARVNALLTGEVDIAYLSSAPQLARVAGNDQFTILDDPQRGMVFAGFNTGRAPFDNVEMRRAVAQAVDKQAMLDIAAPGFGVVVNTPIPPTIFSYDAALESEALTYDVEAARQAVQNAGYDGGEISILTSSFPNFQAMATVMQAQLAEVGIASRIEAVDFAALTEMANAGDYDIVITRYDWNDPDLLRIYLSEASIGRANRYFYANPELDALTAQGRSEFDPEARRTIYQDAQRIVMQDVPWIPLHMGITKVIISNRIQNADLLYSHVVLDDATVVSE